MKFNKLGRTALTSGLSLAMGLGLTACSRDYVAAFLYAPSASNGAISGFAVDYESGILNQVSGSPFPSNVGNATTAIASPDGKFLFELGGSQNSVVESFGIGSDGKLYAIKTTTLVTGDTYPTAAAVDTSGKFLYVTYQYQNGVGPTKAGPGGVNVFPINSDGSLGTPAEAGTASVGLNPNSVALTVPITAYGSEVLAFVLDTNATTAKTELLVFQENVSTGGLTLLNSIPVGVSPSAVIAEPTGRYVYVSDKTQNVLYGFQIGNVAPYLTALPASGNNATGLYPVSMTIDPRGKYLYVTNFNSNSVSGYTINHADGSLGGIATSTFTTATGPTCAVVDPAVGEYLYTSNYLDNSVSGARLTTEDGSLAAVANTPFPATTQPNCITAVANGSHSSSIVNPN